MCLCSPSLKPRCFPSYGLRIGQKKIEAHSPHISLNIPLPETLGPTSKNAEFAQMQGAERISQRRI